MVSPTTVVSTIQEKSVFTKTGDSIVILGVDAGRYYSLNPVGTRFWELIQQPTSIRAAAETIAGEFAAPLATVEQDLLELAEQMLKASLISATPASPAS